MRPLWDGIKNTLAADDLFWRVSCFFFALLAGGLGVLIGCVLLLSSARDTMWWPWQALFWLLAAGLFAWAAVLLLGCVSPPASRPARWAARAMPTLVDFEGDTSLFAMLAFFPAAAITLLLRAIGVRGCKSPRSARIIHEAERNTRSPWTGPTP
jgi:hypothetical protein